MGNECSCLPKNLNNLCFNGGSSSETYSGQINEVHQPARVHVRQVNPPVPHENSSANLSQSKSSMSLDNSRANKSIIENVNRPATYKQLTDEEAAHYSWQKDMLASFMVDTLRPLDVSQVALKWYQCTRTKEVYRGEMSNGKKEGSGEIYWPDGSAYRGCWKNDMRDGLGIYLDVDKIVYIGEWKNNKKHGKGTEILPNGVKREVLWNDGRRII